MRAMFANSNGAYHATLAQALAGNVAFKIHGAQHQGGGHINYGIRSCLSSGTSAARSGQARANHQGMNEIKYICQPESAPCAQFQRIVKGFVALDLLAILFALLN